MSDLMEFLRARHDETERGVLQHEDPLLTWEDRERILKMVARRRVTLLGHPECDETCFTVRMLSLRYDDHPDYRDGWRR